MIFVSGKISLNFVLFFCKKKERERETIYLIKIIHVIFKCDNILSPCRRGSNVSLTLDMSSLGNVEPFVAVPSPREKIAMEYLQSASRVLTRPQLRDVVATSHLLQSEFMVSESACSYSALIHSALQLEEARPPSLKQLAVGTRLKEKCRGFRITFSFITC